MAFNRPVHVAQGDVAKLNKILKTQKELQNQLNREPTNAEIATKLGIDEVDVKYILVASMVTSLDSPVSEDSDISLGGSIKDPNGIDVDVVTDQLSDNGIVKEWLRALEPIPRRVIAERYGLLDGEPKDLRSIGKVLGISGEWVRRLQKSAEDKIRNFEANRSEPGIH